MIRILFVAISVLTLSLPYAEAQQPEWLFHVPRYFRLKQGSANFSVDPTRSTFLFDGGPYDTYATSDGGETWTTIFDLKMFYIDVMSRWTIDQQGRWYYYGYLYNYFPINLVSEDGGKTLQYLVKDTNALGMTMYGLRREAPPCHIWPGAVIIDQRSDKHPFYGPSYSTDAGYTWTHYKNIPKERSVMYLQQTRRGKFGIIDVNAKTVEVDAYTGVQTPTDIDGRSRWVQLDNGTVIQTLGYAIGIRSPGASKFTYTTKYTPTGETAQRPIEASYTSLINDSLAVVFGKYGEVWTVGRNAELRPVMIPQRYSRYQQITSAGMFGDLFLVKTYIPEGNIAEGTIYTLINAKTNAVTIHRRPVSTESMRFMGTLERFTLVPYTDSIWYSSSYYGELLITKNAGRTWKHVSNITPDTQWGTKNIEVLRVFPRQDGSMALLTGEFNRLMVGDATSQQWDIVAMSPFVHKAALSSLVTSGLTDESLAFGHDPNGNYRFRYGPLQPYFPSRDTMWFPGDVVTRYTSNGLFIDTVLPRRSRFLKKISTEILVSAMDSVYFSFNDGREWVYVSKGMPVVVRGSDTTTASIGDILVADDGSIVAGLRGTKIRQDDRITLADSTPGGIVISSDKGNSWKRALSGIDTSLYVASLVKTRSGTLLCVASELRIEPGYYDGGSRGEIKISDISPGNYKLDQVYVYRSSDHGRTWTQMFSFPDRESFSATDNRLLEMPDGRIMALHPTFGVAISADDGLSWNVGDPLNIGNPVIYDVAFSSDGYAHLGTSAGYARIRISDIVNVNDQAYPLENAHANATITRDGVVQVAAESPLSSVSVYSLDGNLVGNVQGASTNVAFDISAAPNGVYIVLSVINGVTYRDKFTWVR
jgi:photosystem II stability/assembly factor-like uncharacterized protein